MKIVKSETTEGVEYTVNIEEQTCRNGNMEKYNHIGPADIHCVLELCFGLKYFKPLLVAWKANMESINYLKYKALLQSEPVRQKYKEKSSKKLPFLSFPLKNETNIILGLKLEHSFDTSDIDRVAMGSYFSANQENRFLNDSSESGNTHIFLDYFLEFYTLCSEKL